MDAIATTIWRDVLEALASRMAQAFHAPRHHRIHVALAVVAMCREGAQEVRIGLARSKQVSGYRIHRSEALVAEYDVQILVGIDECARHVVERDLQMAIDNSDSVHIMERFVHQTTLGQYSTPGQSKTGRVDYSSFNNTFKKLWTSAIACRCATE